MWTKEMPLADFKVAIFRTKSRSIVEGRRRGPVISEPASYLHNLKQEKDNERN
jgi:hypothetical protein